MPTAHDRRAKLLPVEEIIRRLDHELQRCGELAARAGTRSDLSHSVHVAQGWAAALKWQWGHPRLQNGTHTAAHVVPGPYAVGEQ